MNERFDETSAGPAVMEVDRLLRDFYHAEMPHPWPRLRLPRVSGVRRSAVRFSHNVRRLALAASVMLALGAYWRSRGRSRIRRRARCRVSRQRWLGTR